MTDVGSHVLHGTDLGIALLDDGGIAAPEGDVANARSYSFPVQYDLMPGLGGLDLTEGTRDDVRDGLLACTGRLAERGAKVVLAGCGMFARYQDAAADSSPVPLATSSLLQVPLVLRLIPASRRVLVVCVDSRWIGEEHLIACGAAADDLDRVVVRGMENAGHFRGNLLATIDELDTELAERETLDVVTSALAEHDDIAAAVRRETGLPVWDPITLASWLHGGVAQA